MKRQPSRRRSSSGHRARARFPLDPSHLVQRELGESLDIVPTLQLKSTTRHPTIFRKRIAEPPKQAQHGDMVKVVANDGDTVGFGIWNPRAEATVRMLTWGERRPTSNWWRARLTEAVRWRSELLRLDESTDAARLINAEGDGLPGIVVDRYGSVLVLQAFTLGMYQRSAAIARELAELAGTEHWVIRTGPNTLDQEGFLADGFDSGGMPEQVKISEHKIRYELHPFAGHKTGFFCDQRDNRLLLRKFCRGKSVLDLCCYSGGFALNAAQAGAASVTGVDLDEDAVQYARRNSNINQVSIKFVHADAFAYARDMQRQNRRFDVVVLDPPKLIRRREEMHDGRNRYFDLNRLAAGLVAPAGILLTCSCSGLLSMEDFTLTVRAATGEHSPQLLLRTGAAADHPVALNCLETEYLKCLWLRMSH